MSLILEKHIDKVIKIESGLYNNPIDVLISLLQQLEVCLPKEELNKLDNWRTYCECLVEELEKEEEDL